MYKPSFTRRDFLMQKKAEKRKSTGSIAKGLGCGYIAAIALLFAYSLIIEKSVEMIRYENVAIIIISVLSAMICGATACSGRKEGRAGAALISGLLYSVIIVLLAVLINIDMLSLSGVARVFACGVIGAILGGVPRLGKSNKKLRK